MSEQMFSTYQVADMLGTTPAHVAEWMKKGWLPFIRLPDGPVRVSQDVLEHFLQRRGVDVDAVLEHTDPTDTDYEAEMPPLQPPREGEDEDDLSAYLEEPPRAPQGMLDQAPPEEEPTGDAPTESTRDAEPPPSETLEPPQSDEVKVVEEMDAIRQAILNVQGKPETPASPEDHARPQQPTDQATEEPRHAQTQPAEEPDAESAPPVDGPSVDLAAPPVDAAEQVARGILTDAASRGATHVHLWLAGQELRLLLRIDGRLRETETFRRRLPGELTSGVLRWMRTLAGLAPTRPSGPTRTRFTFEAEGRRMRGALTELPAEAGSTMVIALQHLQQVALTVAALGLSDGQEAMVRTMLDAPAGLVLLASPPGDQVDDVFEAIVGQLTGNARHVASLGPASPDGVTPLPANGPAGDALDWARDVDADAIELPSLDDAEPARHAVTASADRLIVSHVTAGDAAEAIDALLAGGVSPGRLAAVLRGVLAVRSARRLCLFCREQVSPGQADLAPLGTLAEDVSFPVFQAVGCGECSQTGYRGVTHLVSVLPATRALAAELRRSPELSVLDLAGRAAGLVPLAEDALRLLRAGYTTPIEAASALQSRPGDALP